MHVLHRPVPSPIPLDEHIRLEVALFDTIRVELQLLPGDGINKWIDHLVEGVEEEGNVDDERPPETLGVVVLEDVQDLLAKALPIVSIWPNRWKGWFLPRGKSRKEGFCPSPHSQS